MILCPKCGNDNPLGRVFCTKCGAKLDFSHTSSQEMAVKVKVSWFSQHGKKVIYLIVLIILAPVLLAFWPRTGRIGKLSTSGGEKKVESGAKAVAAVKKGQVVTAAFLEEDLNAYFQKQNTNAASRQISMSSTQGFFNVRMVNTLFQSGLKIKEVPLDLVLSCDIVCVPVTEGRMTVPKATIGHLPLPGFLAPKAAALIHKEVASDKAWTPFNNIVDIKAENNRLSVTIKP